MLTLNRYQAGLRREKYIFQRAKAQLYSRAVVPSGSRGTNLAKTKVARVSQNITRKKIYFPVVWSFLG